MDVRTIDAGMRDAWEAYVYAHPYAIAWQSWEWSTVLKQRYPAIEFLPLAAVEGRDIRGILPLYRVSGLRGAPRLISVPYAVAGGIVSDSEEASLGLLNGAIDVRRERGCGGITLKQYKLKMPGDLQTDDNYYNRELSLSPDIDRLWSGLAERNREQIDTCKNTSAELDYPSTDVDVFYEVLLRHQRNMGIPCVGKGWIRALVDFKLYSIAFLRDRGRIVAATMTKTFKKTISFPFTSIPDQSEESYCRVYDLYWKLIVASAQGGLEIFHSGRIPNNDQTDAYRLGWGGTKHTYYNQYYPPGKASTEYATKRGRKRQIMTAVWKRLPLAVTRAVGPVIVRQFP